ncbi:MAG: hypothetical protein WC928_01695 [Patescibacteria group bacterium]|jgi:hypothetical protein
MSKNRGNFGRNFSQKPLTFNEFLVIDVTGVCIYCNFFYNFYNHKPGSAKNYERLKKVNEKLAEELSEVYLRFCLNKEKIPFREYVWGHSYPKEILKKGYKAYLCLRKEFSNDPELIEKIKKYNKELSPPTPDDWAAFFS